MFDVLTNNMQFREVYKQGKSYANKYLVMYVLENGLTRNRYGITVSKKVGNSVVRHRVTRLIRESIRLQSNQFMDGFDIVFVARVAVRDKKYQDVESALLHLGNLHKIVKR